MNEKQTTVAAQIANLSRIPMADLWLLWDKYCGKRPPRPNRNHVESRVAYKIQEEAYGGLKPETRSRLEAIGAQHSKIRRRIRHRDYVFAPGTVLLREYGDKDHKVLVTPEGFYEYDGERFRSLTAVARHITGMSWSGPKFFRLDEMDVGK